MSSTGPRFSWAWLLDWFLAYAYWDWLFSIPTDVREGDFAVTECSLDKGHARNIVAEAKNYECLRNQLAYILATAEWETAHTMEPVKEAYWLSESWREENLRYYPWYGRGFVQLTWEENYRRAQEELGLGTMLTDDPDKALDPGIAAQVLVKGCMEGWFTGKKVPDYCTLQSSDYVNARRVVNGTDHATDIAALAMDFEALLLAEGYGVDTTPPDRPEIELPELDLDKIAALLTQSAEAIEELRDRVAELERWRKS